MPRASADIGTSAMGGGSDSYPVPTLTVLAPPGGVALPHVGAIGEAAASLQC